VVDYGIGSQPAVTLAEAEEMIEPATRFIDRIAQILA